MFRIPLSAILSATTIVLVGAQGHAADDPVETAAVAEFRVQVEPLLAKYCQKCHAGSEPKGELALDGIAQRAAIETERQQWEKISEKLHALEMPPEDEPQPTAAERERIAAWIDAGLARHDCGRERDPGRVTIRRLNRNEYNNTIRDLVGIDFRPGDDFPSDDVGYGFDHIGDVLSMPPLLLEKYLVAAQQIVERALGSNQVNLVTGDVTGGQLVDHGRFLASLGEVRTKFRVNGAGEHHVRVRAHGEQAGPDAVKMGVYVDNKTLRVFDVRATDADRQWYEAWAPLKHGQHVLSIVFLNDYYEPTAAAPNDRNLVVHELEVTGPYPSIYQQVVPREHEPEDKLLLAREILTGFSSRAFRRPATAAEVDRLLQLFTLADRDGESFTAAMGVALEAVLVSPHFLFRVELDPPAEQPQAVRELDDYELASRLSYFLWSSMPDDELSLQARFGTLRKHGNLERQVQRMLHDPKAQALVENFAGQWLQLRNLKTASPDKGTYPDFDEPLRLAMKRETELFFAAVMREDRSVLDFIDGDFTFVNGRLARHYGIDGIVGEEFQRVALDPAQRSGVLTQASVLTVTSNPTRTSPVKRGKWVLENLLGAPPPPPPPDVPALGEASSTRPSASLRELMEKHRSKSECAVCHNRMDPLGFGLENYDGIGAWRSREGAEPIDASGTLPGGRSFVGSGELKAVLKTRRDDFVRCLAEKMLTYGLGRGVEYSDQCTVKDIAQNVKQNDYKFTSLILGVVHSQAFQKRKGPGGTP